ncbi:MAG: NADH-quinone oxidoreductase subunit N, partial [Candidatus Paceibacteria bacterium]
AFLVSLTGLPPSVGFYGKLLLFKVGVAEGLGWLVFVAAINSVVSLFYYFSVAKALFLKEPSDKPAMSQPLFAGLIAVLGLLTVYYGLMPGAMQEFVNACSLMGS